MRIPLLYAGSALISAATGAAQAVRRRDVRDGHRPRPEKKKLRPGEALAPFIAADASRGRHRALQDYACEGLDPFTWDTFCEFAHNLCERLVLDAS